jgi:hypothetical protein
MLDRSSNKQLCIICHCSFSTLVLVIGAVLAGLVRKYVKAGVQALGLNQQDKFQQLDIMPFGCLLSCCFNTTWFSFFSCSDSFDRVDRSYCSCAGISFVWEEKT